jgi:hypothetical protein
VCETAAHLWLQQLPFVVVQTQWLPAKTAARELMVNMRSRGTLATARSNICNIDLATALYAHAQ